MLVVGAGLVGGVDDGDDEVGLDGGDELGGAELDGGGLGFFEGCELGAFLGLAEAVGDCVAALGLLCDGLGDPGLLLDAAGPAGVVAFCSEV